jgi:hypothetical protein
MNGGLMAMKRWLVLSVVAAVVLVSRPVASQKLVLPAALQRGSVSAGAV